MTPTVIEPVLLIRLLIRRTSSVEKQARNIVSILCDIIAASYADNDDAGKFITHNLQACSCIVMLLYLKNGLIVPNIDRLHVSYTTIFTAELHRYFTVLTATTPLMI